MCHYAMISLQQELPSAMMSLSPIFLLALMKITIWSSQQLWLVPIQLPQVSSIHNFLALSNIPFYRCTRLEVAPLLLWPLLTVEALLGVVAMVVLLGVKDATMVAPLVVVHPAGARHDHSARHDLKLGTPPTIVGIALKKTTFRSSRL
jgi:hypothetical protein